MKTPTSKPRRSSATSSGGRRSRQAALVASGKFKVEQYHGRVGRQKTRIPSDDECFLPSQRDSSPDLRQYQKLGKRDLDLVAEAEQEQDESDDELPVNQQRDVNNFFSAESQQAWLQRERLHRQQSCIDTSSSPDGESAAIKESRAMALTALQDEESGEAEIKTCSANAKDYQDRLMHHLEDYPKRFVEEELKDLSTLGEVNEDGTAARIWLIMMTTEPLIHDAVVACDVPRRYREVPELTAVMDKLKARCNELPNQPRIYGNFLCSKSTGRNVTPEQLLEIAESTAKYLIDDEYANHIDSLRQKTAFPMQLSKKGIRRVICHKDPLSQLWKLPSPQRMARIGVLIRAIIRRVNEIPQQAMGIADLIGFSEYGFSVQILLRLIQHAKHIGSNYLMSLFDLIAEDLYDGQVVFEQYPIYDVPQKNLAELSEIYFTRAGQGYSKNGGGASHCAAGRSTNSREDFSEEDYDDFWAYAKSQMLEKNVKAYEKKLTEKRASNAASVQKMRAETKELRTQRERYDELKAMETEMAQEVEAEVAAASVKQKLAAIVTALR